MNKRKYCIRGHHLNGDNLYYSKNGKRRCRECQKLHNRKYQDKLRKAKNG